MSKYTELKKQEPEMFECFFAFGRDQFEQGIKNHHLEGKKILSAGHGLYGTQEGIKKLMDDYDQIEKQIVEHCPPQEVYEYEFWNRECSYTCDDREAIQIVLDMFGLEKARTVSRRNAYLDIEPKETPEERIKKRQSYGVQD